MEKKRNHQRIRIKILNVSLDSTSEARVLRSVRGRQNKFLIVTPNPEIIMQAQKDERLAEIINSADFSLPDGVGLAAAHKFMLLWNPKFKPFRIPVLFIEGLMVGLFVLFRPKWLTKNLEIIKGRQLFLELCKLANKKKWKVFFLGGRGKVARKTAENLAESLKSLEMRWTKGPRLNKEAKPVTEKDELKERKAIDKINRFKPNILFVAFGAPKQEKWLAKWLEKLDVGGAMVVGGAFDYMAKKTTLPPVWMEDVGLEWLWRLMSEPKRFKRILKAFPFFPLRVFWGKLKV